jgi:hypothetical protein
MRFCNSMSGVNQATVLPCPIFTDQPVDALKGLQHALSDRVRNDARSLSSIQAFDPMIALKRASANLRRAANCATQRNRKAITSK